MDASLALRLLPAHPQRARELLRPRRRLGLHDRLRRGRRRKIPRRTRHSGARRVTNTPGALPQAAARHRHSRTPVRTMTDADADTRRGARAHIARHTRQAQRRCPAARAAKRSGRTRRSLFHSHLVTPILHPRCRRRSDPRSRHCHEHPPSRRAHTRIHPPSHSCHPAPDASAESKNSRPLSDR